MFHPFQASHVDRLCPIGECLPDVLAVAADIAGPDQVDSNCRPLLVAEDFGAMLRHIPGNFILLGSGVDALPLHNACFDFNAGIRTRGNSCSLGCCSFEISNARVDRPRTGGS